jgi:ATP-binding cassette subfamily B protein
MKPLTDRVLAPSQPTSVQDRIVMLHLLIISLIVVQVINTVVGSLLAYHKGRLSEKIGLNLRQTACAHLQTLSLKYYQRETVGGLYSRILHDTANLQFFITSEVLDFFMDMVMFFGIGAVLFSLEGRLTLLLLLPMPLIVILANIFGDKMIITYRKLYQKMANLSSVLFNIIKGAIIVKTNTAEERELARFEKASTDVFNERLYNSKLHFLFSPSMGFILFLCGIMIRWYGGWKVIRGELSLGDMMVFIGYMWQFYGPITEMNSIYMRYQSTKAVGERVFSVLDTEPEIKDDPNAIELPNINGSIKFDAVTFSYDGKKNILQDINLEIKPGEVLGVMGPSGAGKTSLIHLLCRLYDPTCGSIYIDGHELRKVKMASLLKHIGIVLQDTILFSGTISENIAYARPDASSIEIILAARAAGAHDFIMNLPDAYDTILGEGGAGLSGGEKQRISIARVLLKNPKIIIFDEATSAVDLTTEEMIQAAIEKMKKEGHTVITISHKLSMMQITDRLIFIENGQIIECGTYESLNRAGGALNRFLIEKKEEKTKERSLDFYVL